MLPSLLQRQVRDGLLLFHKWNVPLRYADDANFVMYSLNNP